MCEKYQIDISSKIKKATLEIGVLRNCIVHHDGKIANQYFLSELQETIAYQGNSLSLNDFVIIDKKLMALYIEEARNIIALLDYE